MTLLQARIKARKYSDHYNTYWYVNKMNDGSYEPWAHSNEFTTHSGFYCGKEIK
jgi:hypothetical protein